ncbi:hypothetical protein [Arthrobacter sp. AQ5-05]|nr:hypothetical protein [Arthrobacter sp. AQ5-05]
MDNSDRNKRRVIALVAALVVVAAVLSLALALVPLFPSLRFPGIRFLR